MTNSVMKIESARKAFGGNEVLKDISKLHRMGHDHHRHILRRKVFNDTQYLGRQLEGVWRQ